MSQAVTESAGRGTWVLLLLLAGTLLAGACCVGPAALSPFFWLADDPPTKDPTPGIPQASSHVRDTVPAIPPPKDVPPPPGPEPPVRVNLEPSGDFTLATTLDPDDPDPRTVFQCCRRFVLNARADTAYLVEVDQKEISIRVEASGGGPPIEPKVATGMRPQLVFIAERTQAYVVFALGSLADFNRTFTMHIRACDGSTPLPDHLKFAATQSLPAIEVVQQLKDKRFVGSAFAPMPRPSGPPITT